MQTSVFLAHFAPDDKYRLIKRSLPRALSWATKRNSFHELDEDMMACEWDRVTFP